MAEIGALTTVYVAEIGALTTVYNSSEEAGHGHVMYGIIAFQSTGP